MIVKKKKLDITKMGPATHGFRKNRPAPIDTTICTTGTCVDRYLEKWIGSPLSSSSVKSNRSTCSLPTIEE